MIQWARANAQELERESRFRPFRFRQSDGEMDAAVFHDHTGRKLDVQGHFLPDIFDRSHR